MLVAGFFFAAMGVFVKYGAGQFDAAEMAFYRSFVGLVFITAIVLARKGSVRTQYLGGHAIRSVVGSVSLIGYFYAMANLPLATAQTLNYTSPLFLAIATVVVLGEKFSAWLVAAIAIGFVGVALLLQPTMQGGKDAAALIGLFSGVGVPERAHAGKAGRARLSSRVLVHGHRLDPLRRMAAHHFDLPRGAMG
jgi:drug/metabolite transporter (DMT)-like permease